MISSNRLQFFSIIIYFTWPLVLLLQRRWIGIKMEWWTSRSFFLLSPVGLGSTILRMKKKKVKRKFEWKFSGISNQLHTCNVRELVRAVWVPTWGVICFSNNGGVEINMQGQTFALPLICNVNSLSRIELKLKSFSNETDKTSLHSWLRDYDDVLYCFFKISGRFTVFQWCAWPEICCQKRLWLTNCLARTSMGLCHVDRVGLRWDQVVILLEQIVTDILIKVNFSRSVLMIRFGWYKRQNSKLTKFKLGSSMKGCLTMTL